MSYAHLPKVAKPVWANQLTRLSCLVGVRTTIAITKESYLKVMVQIWFVKKMDLIQESSSVHRHIIVSPPYEQ